jgi:hypothetical protein
MEWGFPMPAHRLKEACGAFGTYATTDAVAAGPTHPPESAIQVWAKLAIQFYGERPLIETAGRAHEKSDQGDARRLPRA